MIASSGGRPDPISSLKPDRDNSAEPLLHRKILYQGGMGDIYRAMDIVEYMRVAIKALRSDISNANPDLLKRTLLELGKDVIVGKLEALGLGKSQNLVIGLLKRPEIPAKSQVLSNIEETL